MKEKNGFTLIELLVVIAVIAILASIGFPMYTDYVTRSKITEATSNLSQGRMKIEQYYQDNRTYVGGPAPSSTTYFTYSLSAPSTNAYTLTATGIGSMAGFNYSIDQNNTHGSTTTWGNNAGCWVTRKGGTC